MAEISKQALKVANNTSFPDNNVGDITPSDLRGFNTDVIDSTVNQTSFNAWSASVTSSIQQLSAFTASQQPSFAALNNFTASQLNINTGLNAATYSLDARLDSAESNLTDLNTWSQSVNQISDNGIVQGYSTRLHFYGLVSASIVPNVNGAIASILIEQDGTKANTASFNSFTASTNARLNDIETWSGSAKISIAALNAFTASVGPIQTSSLLVTSSFAADKLTFTKGNGQTYVNAGIQNTASFNSLALNINSFSASATSSIVTLQNATTALISKTGSYATTGSNLFVGDETITGYASASIFQGPAANITLVDTNLLELVNGINTTGLYSASGSAVLVAKGYTTASAHISASASNQVNLIFKSNNNNSEVIVSGSDNIFANPAAPTAGFTRYVGGSSNLFHSVNSTPQISASMAWSPTFSGNIFNSTNNAWTWRGPVSSSASTIANNIFVGGTVAVGTSATNHAERLLAGTNWSGNALFNGSINVIANTTPLSSSLNITGNLLFGAGVNLNLLSSSLGYSSNVQNGGITVNNRFTPTAGTVASALSPRSNINTIYGIGHDLNLDGTNTATNQTKQFVANILAGMFLSSSVGTGDSCNILATGVIGNSLTISGSSTAPATTAGYTPNSTQGSLFVGRFNATDGNKARTAETIFAVGTGISGSRKTGFLIDSGSNTFIEGSLNVTGSTIITGSVQGNVTALNIVSNTASLDFNTGNFFTLTLANNTTTHIKPTNIKTGQTVNLLITQGTAGTASFSSEVKFPAGFGYTASVTSGNQDLISLVTFTTASVYAASVKNLI